MSVELSGRSAYKFTLIISERQFKISREVDGNDVLIALSSSASTLLKALDQIFKTATGQDFGFRLSEHKKQAMSAREFWKIFREGHNGETWNPSVLENDYIFSFAEAFRDLSI